MSSLPMLAGFDRSRWTAVVDWLAVGVAVSLPWSTSATDILVALWLVAVLPTLELPSLRRELSTAAAYLPVLLVAARRRRHAMGRRQLGRASRRPEQIPPAAVHSAAAAAFSKLGTWRLGVVGLFGLDIRRCCWCPGRSLLIPALASRENDHRRPGQGIHFAERGISSSAPSACSALPAEPRARSAGAWRWRSVGRRLLFLANILFVVTSRTALLVVAGAVAFGLRWQEFRWKGLVTALLLGCVAAAADWSASPYLRDRLTTSVKELKAYRAKNAVNPTGLHLEFLRKSLLFVEHRAALRPWHRLDSPAISPRR